MAPDKLILLASIAQVASLAWLVLLAVACVAHLLLVVFARYSHEITDKHLVIRRRTLGLIPAGTMKIPLEDFESIELLHMGWASLRARWAPFSGYLIYAGLGVHDWVLLSLRRPRYGLFWRVVLGPEDAAALMNEVIARTGAKDVTCGAEVILDRLPLWVADALAALAALLPLALLSTVVAGGISGRDFLAPLGSSGRMAVIASVTICTASVPLAMSIDAARAASLVEDPVFYVWAIGIILLPPLAWVYYVRVWRPRRTGGAPSE